MFEAPCPDCGAPLRFQSSISLLAVCPYCRSLALRKDLDVSSLGKAAQLQEDGSPLQLDASGSWTGRSFRVMGRLQMGWGDGEGVWNEWHIEFADGGTGWLTDAQGQYAVSVQVEAPGPLPERGSLSIDQSLELAGQTWQVKDLHEAAYLSAEGELPFKPPLGEKGCFADLSEPGGSFATIDYSEDAPLLFTGRYVDFDGLSLSGLKKVEGW